MGDKLANRVNFGLWCDFRNPAQWAVPYEAFYQEALDQIAEVEEKGFDSVWLTEHHYCDDGYTPSPMVNSAAIASRPSQNTPRASSLVACCRR